MRIDIPILYVRKLKLIKINFPTAIKEQNWYINLALFVSMQCSFHYTKVPLKKGQQMESWKYKLSGTGNSGYPSKPKQVA